jgi:hypothetical protein
MGNLRPVVTTSAEDLLPNDRAVVPFDRALSLLLYAHEVVADDPCFFLASERVEDRRGTSRWLLDAKQFHEQGLIHFRDGLWSRKRHPALNWISDEEADALMRDPEIRDGVARYKYLARHAHESEDRTSAERLLLSCLFSDARANKVFANLWPGAITQLASSPTALLVERHLLQAKSQRRQVSSVKVLTLMQFVVPDLSADTQLLAAVRRDHEVFEEFRSYVTRALNSVSITDVDDPAQIAAARRDIYDEAAPLRARLDRAVRQSKVLGTTKRNLRSFSVAAATAATSFLLTGSPASAAVTGAASQGVGFAYDHLEAYKTRKNAEQVADLIAVFSE